ncbi:MAG: polyphosphate kinase 1 [Elusimicrobia bacterium]|nr:polyphosphate kinase 1 [Elusimicrobiota bacterium]
MTLERPPPAVHPVTNPMDRTDLPPAGPDTSTRPKETSEGAAPAGPAPAAGGGARPSRKDRRAPPLPEFKPFNPDNVKLAGASVQAPRTDRLFNRDLSWLQFNDRVLDEAADKSVPALERLRYCAIVSSNLDEFFMIRVAEVARTARRMPGFRYPDGMTAGQVVAQIREQVLAQKARQAAVLQDTLEGLAKKGIKIYQDFETDSSLDAEIRARLPKMSLCLRKSSEPLPWLESARIHVFVRFPAQYAILSIDEREARLVELPSPGEGQSRYALVERWIRARAAELLGRTDVIEAFPFKILRDADLRYHPDEETIEEQIVEAVLRRSKARIVRLEVDAPAYSESALFLATALRMDSAGLYRFPLPLDLRTLATLYNSPAAPASLRYPPIKPELPKPLRRRGVFEVTRKADLLLHHPYDDFDAVVRFLQEAAKDPKVTRIYHTLYRTSRESPIIAALRDAAAAGKKVTAYVEIKARFDELNNVRWARELRKGGVQVVRPLGDFKVHSKVTQVVREEEGGPRTYLHLGTGNYHPGTAKQYTDLGLLTSDVELGREIDLYISALSRPGRLPDFKQLLVAPGSLYERILGLIRSEISVQRAGGQGRIIAKMNALVDRRIIEALYDASRQGVQVDLLVRGMCCLRPGVPGLSENIRVRSIVDRFLEHSRVFCFRAGGEDKVYLSSADWMPRNFYTRYEVAFPIKDSRLKRYLIDVILKTSFADNQKAWALGPDGVYDRVAVSEGSKPVRSQFLFEDLAKKQYEDTVLKGRIAD